MILHDRSPLSLTSASILRILLLLSPSSVFTFAAPCTSCPDPNDSFDIQYKDRTVIAPGVGAITCDFIATALPGILQAGTDECTTLQTIGTYCGCPVQEDACGGLCANYNASKIVRNFLGFQGYNAPCDIVHSHLQSFTEGTDDCTTSVEQYSAQCGCGTSGSDNGDIFTDGGDSDSHNEVGSQGLFPVFHLCHDESFPKYPERNLMEWLPADSSNALVQLGLQVVNDDIEVNCGWLYAMGRGGLVPLGVEGTQEKNFAAGLCGCPPVEDACDFCPTNDITYPDRDFPLQRIIFDSAAVCRDIDDMLTQFNKKDLRCWASRNFAWLCGCNEGTPWYLGADSERQHKILTWIPRVSGFLSFLGSIYIIQDIFKIRRRGTSLTTYQILMLIMSLFDISSSIAWMVSTAALPEYDENRGSESEVYGAKGNEATCKAQGFFLELGFIGSTVTTACLTTFYVLTIIYSYRETKMLAIRKYFIGIPTTLALALASAAIPYYRPFYVACLVSNPNSEVGRNADEWRYLILFSILPVGIAILVSICNMAAILRFVVQQNRKADRWRFPSNRTNSSNSPDGENRPPAQSASILQRSALLLGLSTSPSGSAVNNARRVQRSKTEAAVFWQAFWYVMAFLLTWVIYLIGQFKPYFSTNDAELYAFWVAVLVLNPLMGFWNCFVYVKPWTWQWKLVLRGGSPQNSSNNSDSKEGGSMVARLGDNKPTTMISHGSSYKLNPIEEGLNEDQSRALDDESNNDMTISPRKPPSILETTEESALTHANMGIHSAESSTGSSDDASTPSEEIDDDEDDESEEHIADDVFLQEEP